MLIAGAAVTYTFGKKNFVAQAEHFAEFSTLLAGDSQIQRLLPDMVDSGAITIASYGEHYYFTFLKLNSIVHKKNCSLRRVILGIGAHSFAPVYASLINPSLPEGSNSASRYFYLITNQQQGLISPFAIPFKSVLTGVFNGTDWGGAKSSANANANETEITKTLLRQFNTDLPGSAYSNQLNYLKKIDSLCSRFSIELILLSTPYHRLYSKRISPLYSFLLENATGQLSHRRYISFSRNTYPDSYFSDANHLNLTGAKIISQQLADSLRTRKTP